MLVELEPQASLVAFLFKTLPYPSFPLGADLSLPPNAVCTLGFFTATYLFILFIGILNALAGDFKFFLLAFAVKLVLLETFTVSNKS